MRIAILLASGFVLVTLAAMAWQHGRYLAARRGPVQDLQAPFHGATFHALHFLRGADGELFEALRKLRSTLESGGAARVVYAGRVATVGLRSAQLPETDWEAVLLVEHPSRAAFDRARASTGHAEAFSGFEEHYAIGLERSAAQNLAIPQMLLGVRVRDLLAGTRHFFEPDPEADVEAHERVRQLDAFRSLGEDAIVVVNLLKHGNAEQRAADRSYGLRMAGMFAENAHGPMHMGRAVTLEGDAEFDRIAIVYYPGIDYMQQMLVSRFFNGIVGDKQPGDTQAALTIPILGRL